MVKGEILRKSIAAGVLSAAIAISLTSCGEKNQKDVPAKKETETISDKKEVKQEKEDVKTEDMFESEYKSFDADLDFMSDFINYITFN